MNDPVAALAYALYADSRQSDNVVIIDKLTITEKIAYYEELYRKVFQSGVSWRYREPLTRWQFNNILKSLSRTHQDIWGDYLDGPALVEIPFPKEAVRPKPKVVFLSLEEVVIHALDEKPNE